MVLYFSIIAILTIIGWGCLSKKFSWGLVPIVIVSAIISAVICIVVNVTVYQTQGPTNVWADTLYIESNQKSFIMTEEDVAGLDIDLDELSKIKVDTSVKVPTLMKVVYSERRDMDLLWNIGFTKTGYYVLLLNEKQYGIYKAFKDSLVQRKDSLQSLK